MTGTPEALPTPPSMGLVLASLALAAPLAPALPLTAPPTPPPELPPVGPPPLIPSSPPALEVSPGLEPPSLPQLATSKGTAASTPTNGLIVICLIHTPATRA